MDQEYNVISITDEDGVEYELEILSTVTYNGAEYMALTPADAPEDAEEVEVSVLKSVTDEDGEPLLVAVEDEQELETDYELLMDSLYEDEELPDDEDSLS